MSDYETCPDHGDTLAHAADLGLPDEADDFHEHLVCTAGDCGYEVMAA